MKIRSIKSRDGLLSPKDRAFYFFKSRKALDLLVDSRFIDYKKQNILVVCGKDKEWPICTSLLNNPIILTYLNSFDGASHLLDISDYTHLLDNGNYCELPLDVKEEIKKISCIYDNYGGEINEIGEHIIDLKSPIIGIHYGVNLLLGDRTNFSNPLQTTPKSVVDHLGRGSFRAQAAFQVLATKWDMRPEENGFPANRQFYLIEDNKQIFYSAKIDNSVVDAKCYHGQNKTRIEYRLANDLTVIRTIFMLPQYEGLPDATEIQTIKLINHRNDDRKIKLVYTGMFGSTNTDALKVDIIYTSLISQGRILENDNHEIIALSPDYYPEYAKNGVRFVSIKTDEGYAEEFETNITNFIGGGTLENPENLLSLSNELMMRGPQFFALSKNINLSANGSANVDTFTGVVNARSVKNDEETTQLIDELTNLLTKYNTHQTLENELESINNRYASYKSFLQVETDDNDFDVYVNNNLPFQVFYQTFVSRAFAQTQKGYREIGFREIQDIFASMYYFENDGKDELVQKLLGEWIKNVYEMGYVNHNFYFVGKEPGMCSDDQLWLFQALHRYINLTGKFEFLDKEYPVYGSNKTRSVYNTLKEIIRYSAEISIGKHKLPIIDSADWNDCLKVDGHWIDGPVKERLYKEQLKNNNQTYGVPFENNYSESVMNAFLLIIALDQMEEFAILKQDFDYAIYIKEKAKEIRKIVNEQAYVNNYYARVLINKELEGNYKYVGVYNDGLSNDSNIPGSYYLNSFSWAILSNSATEEQIEKMIDVVDRYLKSEAGFKLCTNHNLLLVGAKEGATEQYFLGDRENGGVFKHATMMAVVAMLKASKMVKSLELQGKLVEDAYFMLDLVYPYKNKENPYLYKGNPRFCTQYINSLTKENIGPILSGTSTWLTLAIIEMIGIEFKQDGFAIAPTLKKNQSSFNTNITIRGIKYNIAIKKNKDEYCDYSKMKIYVDNEYKHNNFIKYSTEKGVCNVQIIF